DFVFTLHNSSFGGAYFYISEPCPPLYPKLQGLVVSQGLPLHLGEPYPYFRKLADGMFHIPVEEEIYNFLEKYCDKDPATIRNSGAGIWDYAKRVSNAFTIICEVPYIYDERIADATPTTITKREAVLKSLEISEEVFSLVKERYEGLADHLDSESPFFDVLAYYMKYHEPTLESKRQWTETDKTLDIPATVSEVFEKTVIEKYHSLEAIGQFIRLLDESVKRKPSVQRRLQKAQSSLLEELKRINSEMEKETDFEVIPIQKLVRVQVGTALHVVDFISRRCQPTL
ncbi:MAG: hypothetical protein NWF14_08100, partial [Candidatus Bathyarchaeota archaeon]|nr:hypothetical protein [Candidatus Bathyarchaeota archaeon]